VNHERVLIVRGSCSVGGSNCPAVCRKLCHAAASAMKPFFVIVTSSLTKSPSGNFLRPRYAVHGFLVHAMQLTPGNL
jgi:hypothetical protein